MASLDSKILVSKLLGLSGSGVEAAPGVWSLSPRKPRPSSCPLKRQVLFTSSHPNPSLRLWASSMLQILAVACWSWPICQSPGYAGQLTRRYPWLGLVYTHIIAYRISCPLCWNGG